MKKKMGIAIAASMITLAGFTGNIHATSKAGASLTAPYNSNQKTEQIKWLEEQARPLKTTDPTASLQDLSPLKDMIGSAAIVGLGEATHGAHEVFTMKHRIVNYLAAEMGFKALVLEEGWDRALGLDRYVLTGKGDPRQYLNPVFNTKEIVNLLQWIRQYNADPKHKSKIRIIGMDIQTVNENVYNNILAYVRKHDPKLATRLEQKMEDLIPVTKDLETFGGLKKENKERYVSDAKQISALLEQNKNKLNGKSREFAWIKQNARIIEQFTTMAASYPDSLEDFYLKHDIAMYENAKWTEEHVGKTIVWGHNGHVSKTNMLPFVYPKMSGQHLAEHYGKRYVTIGTSVFEGRYNVYNTSQQFGPYGILKQDDPNNYGYTLRQVKYDQFFVDLRQASGVTKTWPNEQHPFFAGVTTVGPDIPTMVDLSLGQAFDILVHIQNVKPSQLNP
ncbi:erythromycin esterase family protein [Paenibacillus tianjinensis]|uniref:Erythromycin esterase family protein n=1 Tax=Paenibacillus tianjinensis TaxID=2810347 RepID=A0ABX7LBB5_9BACL|nr:erythromycin esterase family protein [Paenibacillus tianjinensis]QSF44566.1 erythromycin esterase family protein [Paenibacillus tianjinensis]